MYPFFSHFTAAPSQQVDFTVPHPVCDHIGGRQAPDLEGSATGLEAQSAVLGVKPPGVAHSEAIQINQIRIEARVGRLADTESVCGAAHQTGRQLDVQRQRRKSIEPPVSHHLVVELNKHMMIEIAARPVGDAPEVDLKPGRDFFCRQFCRIELKACELGS